MLACDCMQYITKSEKQIWNFLVYRIALTFNWNFRIGINQFTDEIGQVRIKLSVKIVHLSVQIPDKEWTNNQREENKKLTQTQMKLQDKL